MGLDGGVPARAIVARRQERTAFEESRLGKLGVQHKESAVDRVLSFASESAFGAFIVALAFLIIMYLLFVVL